jgi:NADPH:quinone reductase-like Zn-dependent oxidoreductase
MSSITKERRKRPRVVNTAMKCVRIHQFGGSDVMHYENAPRPGIGVDDVLVRVHAAAVNPVDWKIREGKHGQGLKLPLVLGWDFSGVVESVGKNVTHWKKGDEVFTRPSLKRDGAYADYIAVAAKELAAKPKRLTHIQAAAVPLAGLTAWQALFDKGELQPGQTVLIHAASGGVGGYAVQFAKQKGARVIATASGKNRDYVMRLGADVFVDYETEKFEDKAHDVDVVLDTLGGETQERSWSVLKNGGVLVSTLGEPSQDKAKRYGVRGLGMMAETKPDQLADIAELLDNGKIRSLAETVFPLSEARKAHELSQAGHVRGKIVLRVI